MGLYGFYMVLYCFYMIFWRCDRNFRMTRFLIFCVFPKFERSTGISKYHRNCRMTSFFFMNFNVFPDFERSTGNHSGSAQFRMYNSESTTQNLQSECTIQNLQFRISSSDFAIRKLRKSRGALKSRKILISGNMGEMKISAVNSSSPARFVVI